MATVSNEPSASVIFAKRSALFATSATWLKPKGTTPISASAGLRDHLAAHQEDQGIVHENDFIMASKIDRMFLKHPPDRR
jgi:hypothetical protein